MSQYATSGQLQAWLGTQANPAEPDRLLQRASDVLDEHLITWRYRTDSASPPMPTDADVINAFADAVCAQVEWWIATQDEIGELDQWETTSFEGAVFSRGGIGARRLCPRAIARLHVVSEQYLARGIMS